MKRLALKAIADARAQILARKFTQIQDRRDGNEQLLLLLCSALRESRNSSA